NVALNDASVSVENDTLNLKVDETSAINATIEPDTIMLKIKYTSSNESVVTVDKNGIVTAVGEGRAIITLEVGDDEIYAKNSTTVTVTVSKINTTADVSIPENIDVGDNVTVDVKLPSDATGNVILKVDGKVIDNVQVTNGTASVKLPALGAGKHTVEVTYSGDDKYKPASKASTINVKKLSTKLSAADVKVTYSVNKYLLITLKDSKGDPLDGVKITVNLNGAKVYTTDSNGQVKIIVGKLVPKTYTAKITFAGNNKYLASSASAKVVVQKANVRITALNKVYKSSVKVKLYPVILKDFTGKVLKNVVVTLKVNGKTYFAKTDANGKAIFKITQLTKKGTYNAVITFKGNNYYNKVVKKATIKVNSVR
ncbi:MAG: Ig-like domain repeat protein, partial [Methanobrevibacter sp.]|nr:Ig-like domain repeat protein [Methanobrevibacter sp.]